MKWIKKRADAFVVGIIKLYIVAKLGYPGAGDHLRFRDCGTVVISRSTSVILIRLLESQDASTITHIQGWNSYSPDWTA